MDFKKIFTKFFKIKKCYRELYSDSYTMGEFQVLKEIYDRYGQNIVDRLLLQHCISTEDAYTQYMRQVLELKNDIVKDDRYNTRDCLIIRETLFVEFGSYDRRVFENIIKFCSLGEHYLEDILYLVAKDKTLLTYFTMDLTGEELDKLFSVASIQLTSEHTETIKERYIWSKLGV